MVERLREEAIQRLALAVRADPDRLAAAGDREQAVRHGFPVLLRFVELVLAEDLVRGAETSRVRLDEHALPIRPVVPGVQTLRTGVRVEVAREREDGRGALSELGRGRALVRLRSDSHRSKLRSDDGAVEFI